MDQLAEYFQTTGTTIRKDLTLLESEKKVLRTYGSVVLTQTSDDIDPPIINKTTINLAVKTKLKKLPLNLFEMVTLSSWIKAVQYCKWYLIWYILKTSLL